MGSYISAAILLKMESLRENVPKSEQQVIDTILASPQSVIQYSISELAARSGVSDPTVMRTCRKLGLNGYQELKLTLARELVNPLQLINENITADDDVEAVVRKIVGGIVNTLESTLQTLKFEDVSRAYECISKAGQIVIIGFGNSRAVASDLHHKLIRVGKKACAYSDPYLAAIAITGLSEDDVVFFVSHSGSSRDVIELANQAKKQRIPIISISGLGISPLSKLSTIDLHTSSTENNYRITGLNSRIAQLAIIDSLHAMLSLDIGSDSESYLAPEKAIEKFNI